MRASGYRSSETLLHLIHYVDGHYVEGWPIQTSAQTPLLQHGVEAAVCVAAV